MEKVLEMINGELGDNRLKENILKSVFDMWWPTFETKIKKVMVSVKETSTKQVRSEREMLEETLLLARGLQSEFQSDRNTLFEIRDLLLKMVAPADYSKGALYRALVGPSPMAGVLGRKIWSGEIKLEDFLTRPDDISEPLLERKSEKPK